VNLVKMMNRKMRMSHQTSKPSVFVFIPGRPVAASRPRVTKAGFTYHAKTYKDWMKAAMDNIEIDDQHGLIPIHGRVMCDSLFTYPRPAKSKRSYPRGDLDNLEKAAWDVITKQGIWDDDDQVTQSHSSKQFTEVVGAPGGVSIIISPLGDNYD